MLCNVPAYVEEAVDYSCARALHGAMIVLLFV